MMKTPKNSGFSRRQGRGKAPLALGAMTLLWLWSLVSCGPDYDPTTLARTEFGWEEGQGLQSERLDQIRSEIVRNRAVLEAKINAAGNVARLYRALAGEYQLHGMYLLSLGAWEQALQIEMDNWLIYHKAGLMASQVAKDLPDLHDRMVQKARAYYRRALDLKPDFVEVLYALGVLEYFEFKEAALARDLIQQALATDPLHVQSAFLAARMAWDRGDRDQAIYWYSRIQDNPKASEGDKAQAKSNQEAISRSN